MRAITLCEMSTPRRNIHAGVPFRRFPLARRKSTRRHARVRVTPLERRLSSPHRRSRRNGRSHRFGVCVHRHPAHATRTDTQQKLSDRAHSRGQELLHFERCLRSTARAPGLPTCLDVPQVCDRWNGYQASPAQLTAAEPLVFRLFSLDSPVAVRDVHRRPGRTPATHPAGSFIPCALRTADQTGTVGRLPVWPS